MSNLSQVWQIKQSCCFLFEGEAAVHPQTDVTRGRRPLLSDRSIPVGQWVKQDWAEGQAGLWCRPHRGVSPPLRSSRAGMTFHSYPKLEQGSWAFIPLHGPIIRCRLVLGRGVTLNVEGLLSLRQWYGGQSQLRAVRHWRGEGSSLRGEARHPSGASQRPLRRYCVSSRSIRGPATGRESGCGVGWTNTDTGIPVSTQSCQARLLAP